MNNIEPRLIQRCNFREHKGEVTGIDHILTYDYMGNANYEFGALGQALRSIINRDCNNLVIKNTKIKNQEGKGLFVICFPDDYNQIINIITNLIADERKSHLEEPIYLRRSLGMSDDNIRKGMKFDCWWDITNGYLFCLGKDNAKKIIKGFKAVAKRWE